MADSKRLVIIDGKSVFYRGYYAMPGLSTKDGTPTGGVYGFAVLALEIIKRLEPQYVCVAWDKSKTNIRKRKELYPEYKAGRKKAPDDFYAQIPILRELLDSFSWPFYEFDDYEADDIMATLAKKAEKKDIETILISSDLDLLQSVSDKTHMYALKKGLSNIQKFDPKGFKDKYGVTVEQFIDLKALMGDSSDNIPGVAGVGKKGAADLLNEFDTLENIYKHLDDIKESTRKKLEASKDMAFLSKKLVTLMTDAPVDLDLKALDVADLNAAKLRRDLQDLEFHSLVRQLPKEMAETEAEIEEERNKFKPQAKAPTIITKSNVKLLVAKESYSATIVGDESTKHLYILTDQDEFLQVDLNDHALCGAAAKAKLFSSSLTIKAYSLKHLLKELWTAGLQPDFVDEPSQMIDVRLAAFVRNPIMREHDLEALVREYTDLDMVDNSGLEPSEQAYMNLLAINKLSESMHEFYNNKDNAKLNSVFVDIDTASIPVLARVEMAGMKLDEKYLAKMHDDFTGKISDLKQTIYGYADQEFNISSPAQLADILYVKLNLPTQGVKKGKTGYSTAANELAKLRDLHPIIDYISEYRELTKLKSTYIDALPEHQDEDGRVRSVLSLTVAATGRLSSSDPNLQNIPVRTEVGKQIRNAFIAEKGNVLVSADYSQFELRLAAILAGDQDMVEAFNSDMDIHTLTASQVFGVALEDVTKEMRYSAKAVNFGILYGQGSHGLAQQTGMSYGEAKEFIDKYFEQRSALREYIKSLRELAKDQGYVETLFGRRRPTPDVNSSNFMVREGAYRQAINMPIQGTEADLMKMAMIKLDELLDDDCRQIMQVHDSIIVECPEAKADKTAELMVSTMENIYPELDIKLKVDADIGKTWGEL